MTNIIKITADKLILDDIVYCIIDKSNNDFCHLEDAIQMFRDKKSAEKHLKDDDVVFLTEESKKRYQKNAVIKKARLTTTREISDKIVFVTLNDKSKVEEDEDSFLYVYDNFDDFYIHDNSKFAVATIKFI